MPDPYVYYIILEDGYDLGDLERICDTALVPISLHLAFIACRARFPEAVICEMQEDSHVDCLLTVKPKFLICAKISSWIFRVWELVLPLVPKSYS